jgi:hypothetical protein
MKIGDRVYWLDPEGELSGEYIVGKISGSTILLTDEWEVELLAHENDVFKKIPEDLE